MLAYLTSMAGKDGVSALFSNNVMNTTIVQNRAVQRRTLPNIPGSSGRVGIMGGIGSTPENYDKATILGYKGPQTANDLVTDVFKRGRADAGWLDDLQKKLFVGGFYNSRVNLDDIRHGDFDEATLDAFQNLLMWTARYNETGEDVSWEEVLDARLGGLTDEMKAKILSGGGGDGRVIALADPAGLRQALDQVSTQTLGRKSTPDEQRMFVAIIHAMQSGAQSAESGTVISPDIGGQAEQMLRQQNAVEAQSHDVARTFDVFQQMLGGMGK